MFERFTDRARRVTILAEEEARTLGHNYVGTGHVLLALIREGDGVAAKVLKAQGYTLEDCRADAAAVPPSDAPPQGHMSFTQVARKTLELSIRQALKWGHNYVGTEHILLGLLEQGDVDSDTDTHVRLLLRDRPEDIGRKAHLEWIRLAVRQELFGDVPKRQPTSAGSVAGAKGQSYVNWGPTKIIARGHVDDVDALIDALTHARDSIRKTKDAVTHLERWGYTVTPPADAAEEPE